MLKRILRRLRGAPAVSAPAAPPQTSWERYRDYVQASPTAIIDPYATVRIFNVPNPVRPCLKIGANSHIFGHFALLRSDANIVVGERCQIGASHFICADSIEVGDDVLMAWGIHLMDNDSHALDWEGRRDDVRIAYEDYRADPSNLIRNKDWSRVEMRPIRIGSRSWIGFNAAILKGVTVGENCVVAAHAVVTSDVEPYSVVAGNPARVVKKLEAKAESR